jgi:hypothetical protein
MCCWGEVCWVRPLALPPAASSAIKSTSANKLEAFVFP